MLNTEISTSVRPFLFSQLFLKFWKQNFMYFGHKHNITFLFYKMSSWKFGKYN